MKRYDRPPCSASSVSASSSIVSNSVRVILEQAIIADWRGELDGETHSSSSLSSKPSPDSRANPAFSHKSSANPTWGSLWENGDLSLPSSSEYGRKLAQH